MVIDYDEYYIFTPPEHILNIDYYKFFILNMKKSISYDLTRKQLLTFTRRSYIRAGTAQQSNSFTPSGIFSTLQVSDLVIELIPDSVFGTVIKNRKTGTTGFTVLIPPKIIVQAHENYHSYIEDYREQEIEYVKNQAEKSIPETVG